MCGKIFSSQCGSPGLRVLAAMLLVAGLLGAPEARAQASASFDYGDAAWQGKVGDFRAILIVTDRAQEFVYAWRDSEEQGQVPLEFNIERVHREQPLTALLFFEDCVAGKTGYCNAEVEFRVYRPNGELYAEERDVELWKRKPPPPRNRLTLGYANLSLVFQPDDASGDYRLEAFARDQVTGAELKLTRILRLVDTY